jgi:hypothetical protein
MTCFLRGMRLVMACLREDIVLYCMQRAMTYSSASRSQASPADCSRSARHKLIVGLAVAALSITLAGRVFHQSGSRVPTARSHAENAKVQHRDRVASYWPSPIRAVHFPSLPTLVAEILSAEENLPATRTDSCVYNRPPPRA